MNKKIILISIILLAAVLRLWKIGSIPPGLTPDEAALGYNAYSILKTGKDEFGTTLPIIFKSFGDYKPGLYVYSDIPFVAVFGLNEISARLPSVLSGVICIYLIFLICKKLFSEKIAIGAAFVGAANPYLIYFSRGAWEANLSLTLTLAGIYFFIRALEKPRNIIFSVVFFALTLLTYQGAKLSTAIVVGLLVLINWKNFWKINPKYLTVSLVLGILITVPILFSFFNGQTERLTIFSIFSYPRPGFELQTYNGPTFFLFHSNQLNYVRMILSRWFNFYSGQFMFFAGDAANPVHTPPYQGVLLLADILLLPLGVFALLKNKIEKWHLFIILWGLLAPFSAAISRDQTNAVRSLNTVIPIIVLISFGLISLLEWIKKRKLSFIYNLGFAVVYLFSFVYFADAYFVHLPIHNSEYSRYGYKQAVNFVTSSKNNYQKILFEQSFNQPYIYFLFFEKYDPVLWQKQAKLVNSEYIGDVGYEEKFDNITFARIDWSKLRNEHGVLVVTGPNSIPADIKNDTKNFPVVHEIKYLNGTYVAFDFIAIK